LFGEDIEDASETNERGVFRHRSGREILKLEFAFFRRRHARNLTTWNEVSTTCSSRWVISRIDPPANAGGTDFQCSRNRNQRRFAICVAQSQIEFSFNVAGT